MIILTISGQKIQNIKERNLNQALMALLETKNQLDSSFKITKEYFHLNYWIKDKKQDPKITWTWVTRILSVMLVIMMEYKPQEEAIIIIERMI